MFVCLSFSMDILIYLRVPAFPYNIRIPIISYTGQTERMDRKNQKASRAYEPCEAGQDPEEKRTERRG